MMDLINAEGLIGDSLSTIPVMIDLAKAHGGLRVSIHHEAAWLYDLIPKKYNITVVPEDELNPCLRMDIGAAFQYAQEHKTYMSASWHNQFGLPTPTPAPRPELELPDVDVPIYDYIFAPFSRSTPENQKWQLEKWQDLSHLLDMDGYRVCVFGNSNHDQKLDNCFNEFDRPMVEVLNMLKKCRKGCISINTGISHLCFAMGTKNYLLNNQGTGWSVHPEAISIETYIPRITDDEMLDLIKNN